MKLHAQQINSMILLAESLGLPVLDFSFVDGIDAALSDSTAAIQVAVDDTTYQIQVDGTVTKGTWEPFKIDT